MKVLVLAAIVIIAIWLGGVISNKVESYVRKQRDTDRG